MQAMVYGYERKEFFRLKRCLRVSKTQDQHQLFIISLYLIVFVEKATYNLINLKFQNSLNICHNANPTLFFLMNNQSQSSDNIRSFIMDAKSHVYSPDFFIFFLVSTFDICCETSFVFPKLSRHSPSFIFDLPLSVGNFLLVFFSFMAFTQPFSQFFFTCPQSKSFFLLALSQMLDFCSKPSLSLLSSLICPSVGCDPRQGFF